MKLFLILIVLSFAAFPAAASPSCMTKSEAREQYRTSHLYWHSEHHCWDDRRGRRHRGIERDPVPAIATVPLPEPRPIQPDSIWPEPPFDFSWIDRWPSEVTMAPERWLLDLMQFGK